MGQLAGITSKLYGVCVRHRVSSQITQCLHPLWSVIAHRCSAQGGSGHVTIGARKRADKIWFALSRLLGTKLLARTKLSEIFKPIIWEPFFVKVKRFYKGSCYCFLNACESCHTESSLRVISRTFSPLKGVIAPIHGVPLGFIWIFQT